MKKNLLLFLLITCQLFTVNSLDFPGDSPELLIGKELKVKNKSLELQEQGYRGFYKDIDFRIPFNSIKPYSNFSKYESLNGKIFQVVSCNKNKYGNFILELQNPEIGIVYYDYNPRFANFFEFEVVGGLQYADGYFCKDIEESKDKFSGKTTFQTPIREYVSFTKVIEDKYSTIYMYLKTYGNTLNLGIEGVIILLSDGTKLEFPTANINVEVAGQSYQYSAFFGLNKQDVEKLILYEITDFRLYIYDRAITNGKIYQEYLKCIVEK